jgi:adenylate kinase
MLRDAVRGGTALGRRVEPIIKAGGLIDDGLMRDVVRERLQQGDAQAGFILDGYPRTLAQARAFDRLTAGRGPLLVINIVVPAPLLIRRLGARRTCNACGAVDHPGQASACGRCGGALLIRDDDHEHVVRARLEVYRRETAPLIDYYAPRPTFRTVDGSRAPHDVTAAILRSIDRFNPIAV